ncbi:MAG: sulfatase [Planctomycetota bacterium]
MCFRWSFSAALTACFACLVVADDRPPVDNVLMLISDDLKASVLGCYGDPLCRTPNLDRLAARGTLFENAYCQGTSCRPSRTSMMFGRYRDAKGITLGEHLRSRGTYTARVGKIFHMRVPGDIIAGTDGIDYPRCWTERFNSAGQEAHTPGEYACLNLNRFTTDLVNRESTRMKNRMFVYVRQEGDGSDQPDHKSASKAIELLNRRHDRPFFMGVGFVRPHYPMVAPPEFFDSYPIESIRLPDNWSDDLGDIPKAGLASTRNDNNPIGKYPQNQKRMWSAYYASVEFMDRQVGRVLDALDASPYRDRTAVIFTSDHGYHLGEHGFWQKSNLHEEVLRVPLIIHVPGNGPGRTRSMTELVDLYPTICELMGQEVPAHAQGTSLLPVVADAAVDVKAEALSFHKGTSIRDRDWHYIRYDDGSEELYEMKSDPGETANLIGRAEHAETSKRLRERLQQRLKRLSASN